MGKKILISERQVKILANFIKETKDYDRILNSIVDDLTTNYESTIGTYREGGEYYDRPMVKIILNNEMITPKDLLEYLKYKHNSLGNKFLKQIIKDWINGVSIKKNGLTANVGLSD